MRRAVADGYTVKQNTQLIVPARGVLANDTDTDSPLPSLTAVLLSAPANAAQFSPAGWLVHVYAAERVQGRTRLTLDEGRVTVVEPEHPRDRHHYGEGGRLERDITSRRAGGFPR
jgi:hypothetical protein